MPPPLIHYVSEVALPQHCEPTSPFLTTLSSYLHICLPTPLALISSALGTLSIASWLFAQLPQIYKNFQLQSTSGLSLFFLLEWCLGDTTNFLGALLTRQAAWQVIIAAYYVLVDVTLVLQFFWYTHYKERWQNGYTALAGPGDDDGTADVLEGVSISEDSSVVSAASRKVASKSEAKDITDIKDPAISAMNSPSPSYRIEKPSSSRRSIARSRRSLHVSNSPARTILLASMLCAVVANAAPTEAGTGPASPKLNLELLGRIFSWMSTVLYLGSRPPQIYKNYRRKSTSGLSPLLFMAAFCGNLFYSSSLLTNPNAWYDLPPYGGGGWADADGNNRVEWLGRSIPFFLGAFGVLFLDGFMGLQFLLYGSSDDESVIIEVVEDSKRGRSRWTRVRGWMRGWIPSVSPDRRAIRNATAENQGLLTEEWGERYGTVS